MTISTTVLTDLSDRGIVISLAGDSLAYDAPPDTLTDADVAILRRYKPEIMDHLRSHHRTTDEPEPEPVTEPPQPAPSGPTCQFCGSADLFDSDDPEGIRCDGCGHLTWIGVESSLRKVGWHDHDLGAMAPEDIPACDQCSRLCDTELVSGDWRCSRCDPRSNVRRRETNRLLKLAEGIRQGK